MSYYKKKTKDDHTVFIVIISIVAVLIIFIGSNLLKTDYTVDKDKLFMDFNRAIETVNVNPFDLKNNKILADFFYLSSRREEIVNLKLSQEGINREIVHRQILRWEKYNLSDININFIKVTLDTISADDLLKEEYFKYSNQIIENLRTLSLKYFLRIASINENYLDARDFFKIGTLYYKKGNYYYHIAKKYLYKSIDNNYKDTDIYLLFGNIFYKEKNLEDSKNWFKKAYENEKNNSLIPLYNYSKSLYYLTEYEECIVLIDNQLRKILSSGVFKSKNQLNIYSDLKSDNLDKIGIYDRVLLSDLIVLKLNALIQNEKVQEAYEELETYKLLYVENEKYYNMLGVLYNKLEMPDIALQHYNKAAELSNNIEKYASIIEKLKP